MCDIINIEVKERFLSEKWRNSMLVLNPFFDYLDLGQLVTTFVVFLAAVATFLISILTAHAFGIIVGFIVAVGYPSFVLWGNHPNRRVST